MAHSHHPSPFTRFVRLLQVERADLMVLLTYTFAVALVTLVVPLAMQALVNTVATGIFVQPIVVLALMVFGFLSLSGLLQTLQFGVVESVQQRVFAKSALHIAEKLRCVRSSALRDEYAPELVNRFFDVMTVQKALSKLLLDGLNAVGQATVAILILGFFNPVFLLTAIGIVTVFIASTILLGTGGLRSGIDESVQKYRVAQYLEDMARSNVSLKIHGDPDYMLDKVDDSLVDYLSARERHFKVCRRQLIGFFILMALGNAGLLAAGGWLVLNGSLTLGQLVAAQIIVALVLASLDKVVRQSEKFFDLLVGLDKLGYLTDLGTEREGGRPLPEKAIGAGARVVCRGVNFGYQPNQTVLSNFDLTIEPGERVSLVGKNGSGKSTLAVLLCGLETPQLGTIEIDGIEVRDAELASLRRHVALIAPGSEIVDGTIEENIVLGREHVTSEDVRWAIETAGLTEELRTMTEGLQTHVISGGGNLSRGQTQRILVSRAIVDHPRLLILDEGLSGIDDAVGRQILERLFDPKNGWTILDISHEPDVVARATKILVMGDGSICECGSPTELSNDREGAFSRLFPYLSPTLRGPQPPTKNADSRNPEKP